MNHLLLPGMPDITKGKNSANELLEMNDELKKHGLLLSPSDIVDITTSRSRVLQDNGRIEIGFHVSKALIDMLADSAYISQDNLVQTANEMYEVFHCIKNATSDWVSDEDILDAIMVYYDQVCGGSTELLMGKGMEKILQNYKEQRKLADIISEEDEADWSDEESGL